MGWLAGGEGEERRKREKERARDKTSVWVRCGELTSFDARRLLILPLSGREKESLNPHYLAGSRGSEACLL